MGLLSWAILGLLAGLIAKAVMPGNKPQGCLITTLLGMAGALVGGWLASTTGIGGPIETVSIVNIITAAIGAAILLILYQLTQR
ncbi:MAG TPA: GlsB/YeaQ/YmgE family stress response membrane protein [Alcanivoracaceae bacterium]|nr:GlsB/YeaQ/YmgE family stress response membrane protein [Alcanivoracaceae bacterium]